MNYPMFSNNNNPMYMQNLQSLQDMRDRIDSQMKQMQQQNQMPQPVAQPITQNFQIAPTQTNNELESKYADNIQDVKNTFVMKTGIFVNKDFSNFWVKDVSGNIRTFRTEEIVEMDEKDKEIYMLKKQIEEMKGMIMNEPVDANANVKVTDTKSARIQSNKRSNAK